MRLARKLALLTTMALAAMALAASSASAQGIEVSEETLTGNVHCNPCVVHASSTSSVVLDVHVFGIEFTDSICNNEFDGIVNEDASGSLVNQSLTGAGCNREPCPSTPWPISGREDANGEWLEAQFCVQPINSTNPDEQIACTIDVAVDSTDHTIEFAANSAPCHGEDEDPAEVTGSWVIEGGEELEITHE